MSESATEIQGKLVFGSPKSHKSRVIVFPRFLADRPTDQCAGLGPEDQVFTAPKGGYLRSANYRKAAWKQALRVAGFDDLRIHDLRANAASLMIAAGASIKAVQRALGHASARVTLDTMRDCLTVLEALADRLDERLSVTSCPVLPALVAEVRELREKGALTWPLPVGPVGLEELIEEREAADVHLASCQDFVEAHDLANQGIGLTVTEAELAAAAGDHAGALDRSDSCLDTLHDLDFRRVELDVQAARMRALGATGDSSGFEEAASAFQQLANDIAGRFRDDELRAAFEMSVAAVSASGPSS